MAVLRYGPITLNVTDNTAVLNGLMRAILDACSPGREPRWWPIPVSGTDTFAWLLLSPGAHIVIEASRDIHPMTDDEAAGLRRQVDDQSFREIIESLGEQPARPGDDEPLD